MRLRFGGGAKSEGIREGRGFHVLRKEREVFGNWRVLSFIRVFHALCGAHTYGRRGDRGCSVRNGGVRGIVDVGG